MADLPKAFLSYSAANRDFVDLVATDLGRLLCFIDHKSFDSAIEINASIEQCLNNSNLFVLFASKASLSADWVNLEINEAFYQKIHKQLDRILVLRLDKDLPITSFPAWLRRCKILDIESYKQAVREIRHHLGELLVVDKKPLFVGRGAEIAEAEATLFPPAESILPRIMAFVGLPQIGRRSVAKRTAENALGFKTAVEITLESSDNIQDVAFKLAAEIEPFSGHASLLQLQARITAFNEDEAVKYCVGLIKKIVESNSIPIFVDQGGLMSEEGNFAPRFQTLLSSLLASIEIYLFLITNRKPPFTGPIILPSIRINSLSRADSKKLLMALGARWHIELKPQQYEELSEYVGGFPPSCTYLVQLLRTYGPEMVMANKAPLVNFRVAAFVSYLKKHTLDAEEDAVLRLLANFSPLPLAVIANFCGGDAATVASRVARLVDVSIVVPADDGMFAIAEPLRDAAYKQAEYFPASDSKKLAACVNSWIAEFQDTSFSLSFSRTIYKIAKQGGDSPLAQSVAHLTADTFQLAKRAYNTQNYEEACTLFESVLELRPDNEAAMAFLVRALGHLYKWAECEEVLRKLDRMHVPIRTTSFLRGFVERKKGHIKEAIVYFEMCRSAGRSDVAVLRELAWCYYITGKLDEAEPLLTKAFELQPDNPFIIDLAIQIAVAREDLKMANEQLERLKLFETEAFYWHRKATIKSAEGNLPSAIEAGYRSVQGVAKPRFEALAHLVFCEIKAGKVSDAATHLAEMEKYFPTLRHDIKTALQCHLNLKSGQFIDVLSRIDQKTAMTNKFLGLLRAKAISAVLKTPGINESERKSLEVDFKTIGMSEAEEPNYGDLPK